MNQPDLLQSAGQLHQPSTAAADEFAASRESLAEELNRRMLARPDLEQLIGLDNQAMLQDNSRNFCRFMGAMFHAYEPKIMVQTVLWVFRAYRSHGFAPTYWTANLETFVDITRTCFSSTIFREMYPFFQWLIVNIPTFVQISDAQMADTLPSEPRHDSGR